MKLKKILASLTATAMAVSVISFIPSVSKNFEVSAAENVTTLYEFNAENKGIITETMIGSTAAAAMANATSSISVTVNADSDDVNGDGNKGYFYLQETSGWSCTDGGYPTVTINSGDELFEKFKASSDMKIAITDLKVNTISLTVDGGDPITVYDVKNEPDGMSFPASGSNYLISASQLKAAGVTADNIADCKLNVSIASTGDKKQIAILASNGENWTNQFYWSDSMTTGINEFPITGTSDDTDLKDTPLSTGLLFHAKDTIITKITLSVPKKDEELPEDSLSFTASNISLNVGDGPAETKLAFKSGRTDFKPEFNFVGDAAKVKVGDDNTLIISPVSAGVTTITAKVTIPDTADSAGGSYTASCMVIVSEKSDSEILWSGSADQGTKWDWNPADISADNCNFKSGDKLVINFTVNGDADYHQLKIMDGSGDHNVLTSPAVSEWGTVDVTSSPYSIELNAADIANVNANGITITGYDVTITSVEKVSASSSEDTSAEVIVESPAGITATVDQSELIDAVGLTPEEIAAGTKIVLNIESAASVSESDKAVIEDSVSEENDQMIELILEININKVSGNNNDVIHDLAKAIPITIDIPNYDPNKEYFIIHVKDDGTSERIDGTVSNGKFTFYAKSFSPYAIISQPRSNPPAAVTSHRISIGSSHVYTNAASAAPGTAVRVFTDFGFDARVYAGNNLIASLRSGGTFIMPASDVRIVAVANMDGALLLNAKPVSYIFVYDTDMNEITVSSSRKSKTDGEITVKLGAKYAGKTVTLYSGKKDTTNMITSETADKNGNVTFSVDLGENYTAVVE